MTAAVREADYHTASAGGGGVERKQKDSCVSAEIEFGGVFFKKGGGGDCEEERNSLRKVEEHIQSTKSSHFSIGEDRTDGRVNSGAYFHIKEDHESGEEKMRKTRGELCHSV